MKCRLPIRRGQGAARAVGAVLLAAVTINSLGVPLPAGVNKRSAERFPCEACPCGCADAESCWRGCCCLTNQQKLAWAERNGVTPPAFVMLAAKREERAKQSVQSELPACCKARLAKAAAACEGEVDCAVAANAQTSEAGECDKCQASRADETRAPHKRFVTYIALMRCKGISISVSFLPPALPVLIAGFQMPPAEQVDSVGSERQLYASLYLAVPTRPPDARVL